MISTGHPVGAAFLNLVQFTRARRATTTARLVERIRPRQRNVLLCRQMVDERLIRSAATLGVADSAMFRIVVGIGRVDVLTHGAEYVVE